jgi:hypothetical protein
MIYRAIQMDPLTSALLPLGKIREMVEELFAAEADYLPQFQTEKLHTTRTNGTAMTGGAARAKGTARAVRVS